MYIYRFYKINLQFGSDYSENSERENSAHKLYITRYRVHKYQFSSPQYFLLWQIAYAEIFVTGTLWPDFGRTELLEAVLDYQQRDRRFGGVTRSTSSLVDENHPLLFEELELPLR